MHTFLPRDVSSAKSGIAIVSCPSVCPSVCLLVIFRLKAWDISIFYCGILNKTVQIRIVGLNIESAGLGDPLPSPFDAFGVSRGAPSARRAKSPQGF